MAWLSSAPKKGEKDKDPKSRMEDLKAGSTALNLPPADPYLVMCFRDSGVCLSGGMGRSPLTWSEIQAFAIGSCYELSGWDKEQLINMSMAYCSMAKKAEEFNCPPPYRLGIDKSDKETIEEMRKRVDKQLDKFFT